MTASPLSPAERRARLQFHGAVMGFASAILVLAWALDVPDPKNVSLWGVSLPGACMFRWLTGYPCAGCGLTRSFVSLAHGQIGEACGYHPLGPVLFAFFAAQIPFRALQMRRLWRGEPEWELRWFQPLIWVFFVALFTQWLWRLAY